ncbi:hypothetical protein [Halalkalibacter nanhaiisediminis]|uniref:Uncharacterized protein n=1 Tax=Halalkalibacter nanhaiisediminis TaxID=688079 RepID=A0A562QB43_9BACI|nr:hypothetical protein [Halalkalibacter nanhaiisediminis]TWI53944.1 hypothetical protein IQ10_03252 [Halalkalibacter nanhaiisediminis]
MIRKTWHASRTMLLSPVALVLTILFLPALLVTDIPTLQQFFDFIHQNDSH